LPILRQASSEIILIDAIDQQPGDVVPPIGIAAGTAGSGAHSSSQTGAPVRRDARAALSVHASVIAT
jgi:hypothetical protein